MPAQPTTPITTHTTGRVGFTAAATAMSRSSDGKARVEPGKIQRRRTTRWRMSSAGLGITTTLLGGSPSGQAAGHVDSQTRFTLVLGGGGMKGVAHIGVLQALTERGLVPAQIVG